MTEWVQIRHSDLPKAKPATVSKKAWVNVWKLRGWKLVKGDTK